MTSSSSSSEISMTSPRISAWRRRSSAASSASSVRSTTTSSMGMRLDIDDVAAPPPLPRPDPRETADPPAPPLPRPDPRETCDVLADGAALAGAAVSGAGRFVGGARVGSGTSISSSRPSCSHSLLPSSYITLYPFGSSLSNLRVGSYADTTPRTERPSRVFRSTLEPTYL